MGPDPSVIAQPVVLHPCPLDLDMRIGGSRLNDDGLELSGPGVGFRPLRHSRVLQTAFCGVWSVTTSDTFGPSPRTGHFCCYDEDSHCAYVGDGTAADSELWCLDTITYPWHSTALRGDVLPPRSGTRAALVGSQLICFGGYADASYFSDLHTIDITSGVVSLVATCGAGPSPRSPPILATYNGRLYVWGGFNGTWPSELSVLDLAELRWPKYPQ
jgi:hypothetical protein